MKNTMHPVEVLLDVSTRSDLCVAVSILSRYTNKRNKELWKCLKTVLRYLQDSIDIKLTYTRGKYDGILTRYIDSDWKVMKPLIEKVQLGTCLNYLNCV